VDHRLHDGLHPLAAVSRRAPPSRLPRLSDGFDRCPRWR
jgi:hypothetical protein